MFWLKQCFQEYQDTTGPAMQSFSDFVHQNLPLAGLGTLATATDAHYWILDKYGFIVPKTKILEALPQYIDTFTPAASKQKILQQPQGTFDIIYQDTVNFDVIFNGQSIGTDTLQMNEIMTRESGMRIQSRPSKKIKEGIAERTNRQPRLRDKTLRKPRVDMDIANMPDEGQLRVANIIGHLLYHTVIYVDEPQIKKKPLPEILMKRYNLPESATLRDLPDPEIINLFSDLESDYKYGDNSSGLNPQQFRGNPTFLAAQTIFDRYTFQTHLEIKFTKDFTIQDLESYIGQIRTPEYLTENPEYNGNDIGNIIIAWRDAVEAFVDFVKLGDVIPLPSEKSLDVARLLEPPFRRGSKSDRRLLSDWPNAVELAKKRIAEGVADMQRKEAIEFAFEMGEQGYSDINEIVGAYRAAQNKWQYKFA